MRDIKTSFKFKLFGIKFRIKVFESMCLSPPGVKLRGFKDQYVLNLLMYRNEKLSLHCGSMLPKMCVISKKNFK